MRCSVMLSPAQLSPRTNVLFPVLVVTCDVRVLLRRDTFHSRTFDNLPPSYIPLPICSPESSALAHLELAALRALLGTGGITSASRRLAAKLARGSTSDYAGLLEF